jgi:hypothetical protein
MRRLSTAQLIVRVLLAVNLLVISVLAHADYKDAYKDGVRAAGDGDWATVESKMREALAAEPNPQAKVRLYGMRFEPYLPHHYLALAASARKNCSAALAAINNSAHISALAQAKDGAALKAQEAKIKANCQGAPTLPTAPTAPPRVVPTQTAENKPAQIPAQTPTRAPTAPAQPPTPAVAKLAPEQVNRVRLLIRTINSNLSTARVNYARPELSTQAASLRAELQDLENKTKQLTQELEAAVNANSAEALARLGSDGQALSARALRVKSSSMTALASLAPATRQAAPPALAQVALLYFSGDVQSAARASVDGLNGKALAHALILRAAARYSVYASQGESKPEQLDGIRQDLSTAKRTDGSVRPSPKFFSPKFIALY